MKRYAQLTIWLCLLCAALSGCGGSSTPAAKDRQDAYFAAREFVRQELKAPASAQFPRSDQASITELGPNRWTVSATVDSQNSFGALLRSTWTCTVSFDPVARTWTTDGVELK